APLWTLRDQDLSLVLSYAGRDTELKNPELDPYEVHSVKLMIESRLNDAEAIANTYVRLGAGWSIVSKDLQDDGGYFILPVQLGMDLRVMRTDTAHLNFFVQAASEVNFLGRHTAARDFDGIAMTIGLRGYY